VAVASAGSYANLHLDPDTQPCQHPTTQFFTGHMPFLPPNQQRPSTEGSYVKINQNQNSGLILGNAKAMYSTKFKASV